MTPITIEPALLGDLGSIAGIYEHYVRTTSATFEVEIKPATWWEEWFSRFGSHGRHRLFVARDGTAVLGYAGSSRYRDRPAYDPSVMTSIYVHPGSVGVGVGSLLYGALVAALEREDVHRLYAGITMPNAASVRLHERFGFRRVGYFSEQGRKFGCYWDVAWYERALNGDAPIDAGSR